MPVDAGEHRPHVRLHGLDALRGIAALLVLLFHYTTFGCGDGLACQPRTIPVIWSTHARNLTARR